MELASLFRAANNFSATDAVQYTFLTDAYVPVEMSAAIEDQYNTVRLQASVACLSPCTHAEVAADQPSDQAKVCTDHSHKHLHGSDGTLNVDTIWCCQAACYVVLPTKGGITLDDQGLIQRQGQELARRLDQSIHQVELACKAPVPADSASQVCSKCKGQVCAKCSVHFLPNAAQEICAACVSGEVSTCNPIAGFIDHVRSTLGWEDRAVPEPTETEVAAGPPVHGLVWQMTRKRLCIEKDASLVLEQLRKQTIGIWFAGFGQGGRSNSGPRPEPAFKPLYQYDHTVELGQMVAPIVTALDEMETILRPGPGGEPLWMSERWVTSTMSRLLAMSHSHGVGSWHNPSALINIAPMQFRCGVMVAAWQQSQKQNPQRLGIKPWLFLPKNKISSPFPV